MSKATEQQAAAVISRGNVLVAAGAGTGKTSTVTERCLHLVIDEHCRLDEILMVTFTEAAAAEMRERLRNRFNERLAAEPAASPLALRLGEEVALLETAPISTLHSFCLDLVRRNFHTLGLDPQFTVLDEQQTKPLLHAVLDDLFERHYANPASALRELVRSYGNGREDTIRQLITSLHHHTQALAAPDQWFAQQVAALNDPAPTTWRNLFHDALRDWAALWSEALAPTAEVAGNIDTCRQQLQLVGHKDSSLEQVAAALQTIIDASATPCWPKGQKTKLLKPIESFFGDATFLQELARDDGAALAQDWSAVRGPLQALLALAQEFTAEFSQAKRELGGIDFADQEQLALRLLRNENGGPSAVALACRERFRFVFVDECQDINAAQDAILRAVSREGAAANRFLVGDVKQSIYRFRLADPRIFQAYERNWLANHPDTEAKAPSPTQPTTRAAGSPESTAAGSTGRVLPLSENFRSAQGLLNFINPLFRALLRPVIGGLNYDAAAELQFGAPESRAELAVHPGSKPRVELHIISKDGYSEPAEESPEGAGQFSEVAELQSAEREAQLLARRLQALKDTGHQVWNRERGCLVPVEFRDMVVLMRGVAGRAEIYAKAFHQAGVPLLAERAGFLDALEITDLLRLLQLLDNPLQDVPLLAVLRSPLVGMAAAELAEARLVQPRGLMWFALGKHALGDSAGAAKSKAFLAQYGSWRELIRHSAITHCLETILTETHYEAILLAGERGEARVANVRRLVELARRFDPFQREGLFRFLKFIAEQEAAEVRHQPATAHAENAVRLMTIHASKGLEFPVVAVAGLGARFNLRELSNDILVNEELGLCPKIVAPASRRRYPSIAHWAAQQRERRALLGEELRLLYVALTRARDTLILTGTAAKKDEVIRWQERKPLSDHALLRSNSSLEWLRLWFSHTVPPKAWTSDKDGATPEFCWKFHDAHTGIVTPDAPSTRRLETAAPAAPDTQEFSAIQERLAFRYANTAATNEPAKTSVSALRRRASERDDEARAWFPATRPSRRTAATDGKPAKLSAADVGNAHHAFMQFVELPRTGSPLDLRNEAERMRQAGMLSAAEVAVLDFAALETFWQSEIGRGFRGQEPARVHREMPFTARLSAGDLRKLHLPLVDAGLGNEEFVVIQGVVDLAAITPQEIWLLDFKTDHVKTAAEMSARVHHYEPQLKLYALALARIYRRPVTRCWLHFLATGTSVAVTTES